MKHMQILAQEPYEAPAILDIMPVTTGVVRGDSDPHAGDPSEEELG